MARNIRKCCWLLIFTASVYAGGGEVWAQSADPVETGPALESEAIPLIPEDMYGENGEAIAPPSDDSAAVPEADAALHGGAYPADDTQTASQDDGHKKSSGGLPQLDPQWYPSQLFWLFLTFTVLYTVFARNVLPALSDIVENRRDHIKNDLDQAEKLRAQAEKVHKAYETIMNEAQHKTSDLVLLVERDIKQKTNEQNSAFRDKAVKAIQETEKSIEKAKKDAMEEMTAIAAEIASEAAKKIVGISTDVDQAKTVVKNISKKAA